MKARDWFGNSRANTEIGKWFSIRANGGLPLLHVSASKVFEPLFIFRGSSCLSP